MTALAYAGVASNDFVNLDDDVYLTENPHLRAGFSRAGLAWAFGESYDGNWFPLTWLSLFLDYELFGLDPRAYHVTNLLLHLLSTGLLFAALLRMTGDRGPALFVAGIFALHPLHAESVAWAAERKDVLSGVFWMATLLAYARFAERPESVRRYLGVVAGVTLSLAAKPMAVTLPFVLLLLDVWPLRRIPSGGRRVWLEKVPLLALAAASSVLTVWVQRAEGAVRSLDQLGLDLRLWNALLSYGRYLGKAFWPEGLAVYYPHPGDAISVVAALSCGVLIAVLTGLAASTWRARPWLAVGWLWFLGTLVPVIGVVQVGTQALADRYTYLPLVGLALALAWGARELASRLRVRSGVVVAVSLVALGLLAGLTSLQVRHWRDSVTLFEHALEVTASNHVAHLNLAAALLERERLEEAESNFRSAIRIRPGMARAHSGLGDVLARRGALDEATAAYELALQIDASLGRAHAQLGAVLLQRGRSAEAVVSYFDAVRVQPDAAEIRVNLGIALVRVGRLDEALRHYDAALRLKPELAAAHGHRGAAQLARGDPSAAEAALREALRLDPSLDEFRAPLALALGAQGRSAEALAEVEAALRRQPDAPGLRQTSARLANNRAWELATATDPAEGDVAEAVRLAELAIARGGRQAGFLDTLARAYAAGGRFPEALTTAQEALALAETAGDLDLTAALARRMIDYAAARLPEE